jgi:hypothetical protein
VHSSDQVGYAVCSGFEIARPVEIGNQPGLLRLPLQQFPSSQTRGRAVDRCEMREPAKVVVCFLGGLADDGHVQAAADHAGDVAERHALVGDSVIRGSSGTLLKHEPVEMSSIEPVNRGPAVKPVANIRRNALFTRDADESRNETVITVAMDRWRKPYTDAGTPCDAIESAASSEAARGNASGPKAGTFSSIARRPGERSAVCRDSGERMARDKCVSSWAGRSGWGLLAAGFLFQLLALHS